jgi:hypothetical protein
MEDRSQQVLAVGISFIALAWISVAIRVYVRAIMQRFFGMDDWLMVLTLVKIILSCQLAAGFLTFFSLLSPHISFVRLGAYYTALEDT